MTCRPDLVPAVKDSRKGQGRENCRIPNPWDLRQHSYRIRMQTPRARIRLLPGSMRAATDLLRNHALLGRVGLSRRQANDNMEQSGSGRGTRTPDPRIMIPVLAAYKSPAGHKIKGSTEAIIFPSISACAC